MHAGAEMALRNVHTSKKTASNIHFGGVDLFRKAVGDPAYQEIVDWLMGLFENQEWVNTTFEAPKAWQGTPLYPVWHYFRNIADEEVRHQQSAIMYGCVVYSILHERPETYLFHRPEGHHSDDTRPFGLTYRREQKT